MTLIPLLAQISPRWIDRNDEGDFLDSQPSLDALLAFNCVVNVLESLEVNESIEFVFRRKPRTGPCLVVADPSHEVIGNTGGQGLRTVRHDVDEVHRSFAQRTRSG